MIYAVVVFCCIDGFIDFAGYAPDAIEIDRRPSSDVSQPQVGKEVPRSLATSTCNAPFCRVQAQADSDNSTCPSGDCPAPARRFQPLRNFFRGLWLEGNRRSDTRATAAASVAE